mgnify:CR=1 FL=1|jgi:hypothetical protein
MTSKPTKPHTKSKTAARVPTTVERSLGQQLKTYYDGITNQEIPDRFLQLLQELDEKTS